MHNPLQHKTLIAFIMFFAIGVVACGGQGSAPSNTANRSNSSEASAAAEAPAADAKLNLNTVSRDDLLNTIPDFGSRMVREFHEYRPYISIQQFRREIGKYVDEAQVAFYEQYVFVPININESDAETLKQIPGVDDGVAEALMAARPFDSNSAFLEMLSASISADEVTVAEAFLEAE